MLKQGLQQKMQQRLSPLQIQTIKLLELPAIELEQRIKKEIEENPVLDEEAADEATIEEEGEEKPKQVSLSNYNNETPAYKLYVNNRGRDDDRPQNNTFSVKKTFQQALLEQLGLRKMSDREKAIAVFVIGSLDQDGYLRRDLASLADDIFLRLNFETSAGEIEKILKEHIQQFDPKGVGARTLQECLLLQIADKQERTPAVEVAGVILEKYFEEFTKKHYSKIEAKLGITEATLKEAIAEITKLNPRPGGQVDDSYIEQAGQIVPDFVLENNGGRFTVSLPRFNLPEVRVNKRYADLLAKAPGSDKASKEAASFVKQKLDSAKWFIEAIKQRQHTLQSTVDAIVEFQKEYFADGDETKLKPMVLKNIAEKTGLDISTISRVVNCKYIQTPFGIYPLKYFFSEGMVKESGEEVSTREIKHILQQSIEAENKMKPLTDEELVGLLGKKGYIVARRTVAKYREQLSIPIARLRKEL